MRQSSSDFSGHITLAIHSTDNSFGFAFRQNNNEETDTFFIKEFRNDLCNNLIVDFNKFISRENLRKVNKISVSIGPANFNASRLIVVLARTISQQINCPIESFSSFELMAKRIALENNLATKIQSFWIYKKLKRRGFITGKYEVYFPKQNKRIILTRERVVPKMVKELKNTEPNFEANFDDIKDLKELLTLSTKNQKFSKLNSWEKVIPLYPISPVN